MVIISKMCIEDFLRKDKSVFLHKEEVSVNLNMSIIKEGSANNIKQFVITQVIYYLIFRISLIGLYEIILMCVCVCVNHINVCIFIIVYLLNLLL